MGSQQITTKTSLMKIIIKQSFTVTESKHPTFVVGGRISDKDRIMMNRSRTLKSKVKYRKGCL